MWVISFWTNSDDVIGFVFAGLQVSSGHTVLHLVNGTFILPLIAFLKKSFYGYNERAHFQRYEHVTIQMQSQC